MRRRGVTLLVVLWFVALSFAIALAAARLGEGLEAQVKHHKMQQAAAACAVSGADYAQAMLKWHRWHGTERFVSPELGTTGHFAVRLRPAGASIRIESVGQAGDVAIGLVRTVSP